MRPREILRAQQGAVRTWPAGWILAEGSRLRKALNYLTNQWPALCTFLSNGRVPIHNNESERQLRSLIVGRANWLFVATFVSLVASCQLHGIDSEQYLRDLFRVLPVWPKNRMLELAPKFWRARTARRQLARAAAWPADGAAGARAA